MNKPMPRTPFSTPLSGSARVTEMRLRNIFSGPKKRPPALFLAAVFAACLLCGNLVSCQMAQAEADPPEPPAQSGAASRPDSPPEAWTPVELDAGLMKYIGQTGDWFYEEYGPSAREMALLENLPAAELPREAVEIYNSLRQDYWRDTLLPVAYDEKEDVTVYFVINPDSIVSSEPGASPDLWGTLEQRGIVLRRGNRAEYFHLCWDGNAKCAGNPLLLVDDFDSDGQPEAAVALCLGGGTGAYEEDLYIFELDTMTCTVPDFTQVPLEIFASSDGTTARLVSGGLSLDVDITELAGYFDGKMEVGNIVSFRQEEGRVLCTLGVDFTHNTLSYMADAAFPVIYEDGVYKLGPAAYLADSLPG